MTLYAGLISGTSMDGVEAVLLDIEGARFTVRAAVHVDYPEALGRRLRVAVADPAACDLDELGALDAEVGDVFADAAQLLLRTAGTGAGEVRAIGSHGQTVLHRPRARLPFTMQIGDPNRIAEKTAVDVVADFRRRDMAAGGEAAPLLPSFHAAAFAKEGETRVVVNIGGIANVTVLGPDGAVSGFDTGPGNCLMDLWAGEHLNAAYDEDGRFAASAKADPRLLQRLLTEPYLALPAPKSTGRELFQRQWLQAHLAQSGLDPAVVQSTLCEFTATSIAMAIRGIAGVRPSAVLVCGGGAYNSELMRRLASRMPDTRTESTAVHGVAPEHVEAAGFAWLAQAFIEGRPGNIVAVTGARGPRVLGALYRGSVINP
jgi:anhydro-N-acetylmuramic acid kinase